MKNIKKLIRLMGVFTLTTVTASSVVACCRGSSSSSVVLNDECVELKCNGTKILVKRNKPNIDVKIIN